MTFYVEGIKNNPGGDGEVRRIGEYGTVTEAIAEAQRTVLAFLKQEAKPGVDAKMLFELYHKRGEHPFIFRDDDKTFNVPGFNHALYAQQKAKEICAGNF